MAPDDQRSYGHVHCGDSATCWSGPSAFGWDAAVAAWNRLMTIDEPASPLPEPALLTRAERWDALRLGARLAIEAAEKVASSNDVPVTAAEIRALVPEWVIREAAGADASGDWVEAWLTCPASVLDATPSPEAASPAGYWGEVHAHARYWADTMRRNPNYLPPRRVIIPPLESKR